MNYNINNKPKHVPIVRYIFFVIAIVAAGYFFLTSSYFKLDDIEITGINKFSKQDLLNKIGFEGDINIFMFDSKKAKRLLESEPYIKSADIKITPPNTVTIDIKERVARSYIQYMGSCILIDVEGRVLGTASEPDETLPQVVGLDFKEFTIGQLLSVTNLKPFDIVVNTAQLIVKYNLSGIVTVDVSDPLNVKLIYKNVDILLGDCSNYDEKVRIMVEILKVIKADEKVVIDLQDSSNVLLINPDHV